MELEVVTVNEIKSQPEQMRDNWYVLVEFERPNGKRSFTKLQFASKREAIALYIGFKFLA